MPQPFLEPPLQSLPLTRIAHSSRSHILPCSYPPVCRSVLARVFTRRFRRLPCVNMVAWFPRRQKPPFRVPQHSSRSSSDLTKRNHPVPLASSASKSLSPCESVRASFGFPRGWWPLLSWVLASLEPPPLSPWSLKPTQPEGQALLPRSWARQPCARSARLSCRRHRPPNISPKEPVRTAFSAALLLP
jgi:hypothetical protein